MRVLRNSRRKIAACSATGRGPATASGTARTRKERTRTITRMPPSHPPRIPGLDGSRRCGLLCSTSLRPRLPDPSGRRRRRTRRKPDGSHCPARRDTGGRLPNRGERPPISRPAEAFTGWLGEAGFAVRTDLAGNLIGHLPGTRFLAASPADRIAPRFGSGGRELRRRGRFDRLPRGSRRHRRLGRSAPAFPRSGRLFQRREREDR